MATFTVTTLADENDAGASVDSPGQTGLSLREAIALANGDAGADTIVFAAGLNDTIRLDGGDGAGGTAGSTLSITQAVTIDGDGRITISGDANNNDVSTGGTSDITDIDASGTAAALADNVRIINASADITLDGLILTGGMASGHGGAVSSSGSIALTGSTVTGNRADGNGGGVSGGNVTLTDSTVSDNIAFVGGGISAGTVNLANSTVSGNAAVGDGSISADTGIGGGFRATSTATLLDSTVSDNTALGAGGFRADNSSTVTNSTISGNHATISAGGIRSSFVELINSTVSGNSAVNSFGGIDGGEVRLTYSTVSGNSALFESGGIHADGVSLFNSIVLGNTAPTDAEIDGALEGSGVNIVGVGSDTDASDSLINAPSVGSIFASVDGATGGGLLADNGGPVQTIALKLDAANPAIDAGEDTAPILDARGLTRVDFPGAAHNGANISDLGAFEAGGQDPFVVTTLDDIVDATDDLISLREAIDYAEQISGADTITFDPALLGGTIRLTHAGGSLAMTEELTIDGDIDDDGDPDILITGDVDGDDVTPVGDITDIALSDTADSLDDNVRIFSTTADVTLIGLTLTGGVASGSGEPGGAVLGSDAGADLTLTNMIVAGNHASFDGGGIAAAGNVKIIGSTLTGNEGGFRGGGVFADGTAEITGSTFSGNQAAHGGGVFVDGTASLVNTTLSGNSAAEDGDGGGLFADTASLVNSTVSGNAAGRGGGIYANFTGTLTNTIVLGNAGGETSGTVSLAGGNIVGTDVFQGGVDVGNTTAAAVFASTVDIGGGVLAGVLAENGGSVQTIALKEAAANPALDASDSSAPGTDARGLAYVDQAGIANSNGSPADLGAFELQTALESQSLIVTTLSDVVDATDGLTSLREAIAFANSQAGADTITFDQSLNGTIRLDGGDGAGGTVGSTLSVTDELTIDGDGRILVTGDVAGDDTTVGGITNIAASLTGGPSDTSTLGDNVRIIDVTASNVDLAIEGLTLTGGVALGSGSARIGGAIVGNNVTVTHSTIAGNQADNAGGGIYGDIVTVIASTVSGNSAGIAGGGAGGGIAAESVTLIGSTLSGNSAIGTSGNGGAVYAEDVHATNTTIAFNSATGSGGGIRASGDVNLVSTTVTGNSAGSNGGGVYAAGTLDLHHTVALGNMAATGDDTWSQQLTFTNQSLLGEGFVNSIGLPATGGGTAENVFAQTVDIDPGSGVVLAGVLANNGGPVQTVALRDHEDNLAIDFGHASIEGSTTTDARGMPRVDHPDAEGDGDLIIDLGAFEVIHNIVVTTLDDVVDAGDDLMSLREAIEFANLNPGADTITFDASLGAGGTIRLTHANSTLQVTDELTVDGDIDGDGKADILVTGDRNGDDTLVVGTNITFVAGTAAGQRDDNVTIFDATAKLALNGLVLTGGVSFGAGGAITSTAELELTGTTVTGNRASSGGGVYSAGAITLTGSVVSDNVANGFGVGGGIASDTTVTLESSTVSGNIAGSGGGVFAEGVSITGSTLTRNLALLEGGGVYAVYATLENATITQNAAGSAGGGILANSASIVHATITGNHATDEGGGVHVSTGVDLTNAIVLGNGADASPEVAGNLDLHGGNIVGGNYSVDGVVGATGITADEVFDVFDPISGGGVVADNGGAVWTVALKRDLANLALDTASATGPETDARGDARQDWAGITNSNGSPADLGAFELQNTAPTGTNLTQAKTYLEDAASVALDNIAVSDADVGDTITARLTLANPAAGALTTSGAATYSALTGVWTITGTLAQVNAALAAVAFVPAANFNGDTTIATHIVDAQGTGPADGTINLDGTPVDDAPLIGSNGGGAAATVQVAENTTAVTKVVATDIEGAAASYAIAGGADAAHFAINAATGALAFKSAPDFEKPADVGANNVYEVIVRAFDGGLSDTQALSVSLTDIGGATIVGTVGDDLIDSGHTVAGRPFPSDEGDRINGKAGDDTITGGAGNDRIKAGRGNDRLGGGDGDDVFFGGRGRNVLTGGQGDDTFVFTRKIALGKITDYEAGEVIQLAKKAFPGIGSKGVLGDKYFHVGAEADTPDQHILYDDKSGLVLYAKNGSDTANPRAFLKIGKGLDDFDHTDITVI